MKAWRTRPPNAAKGRTYPARNSSRIRSKISTIAVADRHPDGEDRSRHTGQRQHSSEARERGDQQHPVQQQRKRCVGSRTPVINQHDDYDRREAGGARLHAMADGVRAERGFNGEFLDDFDGRRQRARTQVNCEILRLGETVRAANLAGVPDGVLNHRRAQNLPVENDRGTVSDVRLYRA